MNLVKAFVTPIFWLSGIMYDVSRIHIELSLIHIYSKLVTLFVTDKRTSICIKAFVVNEKWDDIDHYLGAGDGVKIKGQAQWDRFDNCTVIMADSIEKAEKKERMDTYPEKRVELHAHTKMSAMDLSLIHIFFQM